MTKIKYSSLAGAEQKFAMLDVLPDTHAWIKDTQGRFVYGNRLFFERFGFCSLDGLVGKCDYTSPPHPWLKNIAATTPRYCKAQW